MRFLSIALLLTLSIGSAAQGQSSSPAPEPAKGAKPVVMFSTDYGLGVINGATNGPDRHATDTDDAYALTLALQGADVQAIITTFGNGKARPSAESARRGLSAAGIADPGALVVAGSEGFLDAAVVTFEPSTAESDAPIFCVNEGVERMDAILQANEPATVALFAIGPVTDVACLQRAYPDSFERIGEIIALVGSSDGTPVLEGISVVDFNFAMDPTALGEVIGLNSSVPVTFLMFEVSQLGSLSNEVIEQWISAGTATQRFYGQATQPHAQYWDAIFTDTDGQALFDAHTVYYFLGRDRYTCENDMLATATVGGYPDTSASTTKNTLVVTSSGGTAPVPSVSSEGSPYTYSGPVRGCTGFADADGVSQFEQAVIDSVVAVSDPE